MAGLVALGGQIGGILVGVADMQRLIIDLGYEPRQRDNWYRGVISLA